MCRGLIYCTKHNRITIFFMPIFHQILRHTSHGRAPFANCQTARIMYEPVLPLRFSREKIFFASPSISQFNLRSLLLIDCSQRLLQVCPFVCRNVITLFRFIVFDVLSIVIRFSRVKKKYDLKINDQKSTIVLVYCANAMRPN